MVLCKTGTGISGIGTDYLNVTNLEIGNPVGSVNATNGKKLHW